MRNLFKISNMGSSVQILEHFEPVVAPLWKLMRRDGLSIREIAWMFAPVAQHGAALLRSNGLPTTSERRSPASSTVHIKSTSREE